MPSLRLRSLQNDMDIGRESISANRNIVFFDICDMNDFDWKLLIHY